MSNDFPPPIALFTFEGTRFSLRRAPMKFNRASGKYEPGELYVSYFKPPLLPTYCRPVALIGTAGFIKLSQPSYRDAGTPTPASPETTELKSQTESGNDEKEN